MKKLLYFLLVSFVLISCKDDFDISKLQDFPRLVVYCFPTVGDTTMIVVTKSVPVATAKGDREKLCRQSVDAHIIYKVNGAECPVKRIESLEEARRFTFSGSFSYVKDVCQEMIGQYYAMGKQHAGDNVTMEVTAEGFQTVSAATYIPQQVKVGIDELSYEEVDGGSVLDYMQASFSDDGGSKDYYSVQVKKKNMQGAIIGVDPHHYRYEEPIHVYNQESYEYINEHTPDMIWNFDSLSQVSYAQAIDTEKEPVLNKASKIDEDLGFDDDYRYYGLAYIFDDHLLNGKKYTLHLTLGSTMYSGGDFYYYSSWDKMFGYTYSVELSKLTPEYYRYLSSINSAQNNSWAEAGIMQVIPTYSNVRGGFGVVAGYNTAVDSVRVVPPKKEEGTFYEMKDAQGVGHPTTMPDNLYHNVTERTVRNHGGKWCFWRVKSSVTLRSGDVFLSLGWIASNYNIEYCRNNIYYTKGKRYNGIDKYKHSGTLFASITGQF